LLLAFPRAIAANECPRTLAVIGMLTFLHGQLGRLVPLKILSTKPALLTIPERLLLRVDRVIE